MPPRRWLTPFANQLRQGPPGGCGWWSGRRPRRPQSPPTPGLSARLRPALELALFALAWLVAAEIGRWLSIKPSYFVTFSPVNGLYLAVLLSQTPRRWPALALTALLAGLASESGLHGNSLALALALWGVNTLEALAGALLLRAVLSEPLRLDSVNHILALTGLGAVLPAVLGASLGALLLYGSYGTSFSNAWLLWWSADALGVLITAPLVLTAIHPPARPMWRFERALEGVALLLGLAAWGWWAFAHSLEMPMFYTAMPLLLWAGLRFGVVGAAVTLALFTALGLRLVGADAGLLSQVTPLGRVVWVQTLLSVYAVTALLVAALFHEQRRLEAQALRRSDAFAQEQLDQLNAIYDTAPVGLCVLDPELRYVRINRRLADINGVSVDDHLGRRVRDVVPNLADSAEPLFQRVLDTGEPLLNLEIHGETPARPGLRRVWLESAYPLRDGDGVIIGLNIVAEEVTERKRAEQALFEEKERALVTLHSIGDAVITTDAAGKVQFLNPVAENLTGWSAEAARGQPLPRVFQIFDEETGQPAPDPVARCLQEGQIAGLAAHSVLRGRAGREYAVEDSAAPIRGADGRIFGAVLVFRDVTAARRLARAVSYQATHDGLTGLINRQEFERRLARGLETVRGGGEHALGYLDLDQFKVVNDVGGHVAGDELLRQLSHLLRQRIRKRDTLARLGGDEFAILMEHCSVRQALRVAETVRQAVEEFRFSWEGKAFSVGVSIGLVAINQTSGGLADVLGTADAACYLAKEQGRNRVHIHHPDDAALSRRQGDMQWGSRLPRALEEGRLRLWRQPILPLGAADPGERYEILLRLKDEQGRLVSPGAFLPAAERHNLASRLDCWVVDAVCDWLTRRPERLAPLASCSINLSARSLSEAGFLNFVVERLARTPLPPAKLCFEITETAAIANLSQVTRFIEALKVQGCRFALDDFGSGLCSFAYLKNLPVNYLKIDSALVRDIAVEPASYAIVKSIHEIGQVMGKRTIAESVENAASLDKLRAIGVDYAQGYWLGRPEPLPD